jgi:hypothetical protein
VVAYFLGNPRELFLPTFPLFAAEMMLVRAVLLCGLAARPLIVSAT